MEILLKDWIENKIKSEYNGGFLVSVDDVVKETEKALYLRLTWGYTSSLERVINVWVPKSATQTREEYENEVKASQERFDKGVKYNIALLQQAKENGVKGVRKGMRTETLLNKLQANNITPIKREEII